MERCWARDDNTRPTFAELLQMLHQPIDDNADQKNKSISTSNNAVFDENKNIRTSNNAVFRENKNISTSNDDAQSTATSKTAETEFSSNAVTGKDSVRAANAKPSTRTASLIEDKVLKRMFNLFTKTDEVENADAGLSEQEFTAMVTVSFFSSLLNGPSS